MVIELRGAGRWCVCARALKSAAWPFHISTFTRFTDQVYKSSLWPVNPAGDSSKFMCGVGTGICLFMETGNAEKSQKDTEKKDLKVTF